jgi:hypothetical protein
MTKTAALILAALLWSAAQGCSAAPVPDTVSQDGSAALPSWTDEARLLLRTAADGRSTTLYLVAPGSGDLAFLATEDADGEEGAAPGAVAIFSAEAEGEDLP